MNMAKAVVYGLLATAFILFLVFFPQTNNQLSNPNCHHHSHLPRHTGLNRRLGSRCRFGTFTFDPLLSKVDRVYYADDHHHHHQSSIIVVENNKSDHQVVDDDADNSDHDLHRDQEYYRYDGDQEGRLNITLRLIILFPLLDQSPKDGIVTSAELGSWITAQAVERLNYTTRKELASHDLNGDGLISFHEYLPQFSDADIEKDGMAHGEAGWWKQQFMNADVNGDGFLTFDEFKDLLHPQDSQNEKIQRWLLREKIKRMDLNYDGKLNFAEFSDNAYGIYKNYVEYEASGADTPTAHDKFTELDVNKDKLLTVEELKPILSYLHPGELSYAKYYTNYLLYEADENKDGSLTLEEMLSHEYIFYSTVYSDDHEDYEDDFHDEL
ncbi:hypothetical protein FNV43_RR23895 [Rhamnella rubrinervis]|uniref:EF-hand domain-containing protein n=1 Tax=Rhamnella rubrinervis TaxID=2594499 RepID=A0A8K0GQ85_9ROSA|nr:hypothetical protein FNV43_RR23895 [Rhamnella rubrinervis]